jgi:hypothetical protein
LQRRVRCRIASGGFGKLEIELPVPGISRCPKPSTVISTFREFSKRGSVRRFCSQLKTQRGCSHRASLLLVSPCGFTRKSRKIAVIYGRETISGTRRAN